LSQLRELETSSKAGGYHDGIFSRRSLIEALSSGLPVIRGKYPMRNPTGMQIVRRAYQLWEQAGKPEGRDQEFYHEAERQLKNEEEPKESPEDV
jgi:hypothetical protein